MKEPERQYPSPESYVKRTERRENNPLGQYEETHPAYGTISMHNVSGSTPLFMSDLMHNHFVEIQINEASKNKDGERDWIFAKKRLTTVRLSSAQFAEFITTPNRGSGVPCTIEYVQGDPNWDTRFGNRPDPPKPQPFADRFKEEGKRRIELMNDHLQYAKGLVDTMLEGATIKKGDMRVLKNKLEMAMQEIRSNLPYVMQTMEEAVEKRMSNAVTEFESYVGMSLQRMGLEALQAGAPMFPPVAQNLLPETTEGE